MIGAIFWAAVGFLVYTYAGYPLIVWLASRLKRRPTRGAHTPPLTLIIAAYNEERVIGWKIEQSLDLDYPPDRLQIIVATDGSDDETPTIARSFEDRGVVVSHSPERRGKMAAINRAMSHATGDIVVFSDANNRYAPDALRALAAVFAEPGVGAASGRKTVATDDGLGFSEGLYWKYEAFIRRAEDRLGSSISANGEIFAIRRHLFEPAPAWVINDDAYMTRTVLMRGHDVAYAHDAISSEQVSSSAEGEVTRRSRMVSGQWTMLVNMGLPWRRPLIAWMILSHKVFRQLIPIAMITALATNAVALAFPPDGGIGSLGSPWNAVMAVAQATFYALAALGDRLGRIGTKLAYVPRFLVDSNIAAVRGFLTFAGGRQTALWDRVERRGEVDA